MSERLSQAEIVELETLSLAEIQTALPQAGIEMAIVRGGFPELYANPDIDSVAFYNSYLAMYVERDVRSGNLSSIGRERNLIDSFRVRHGVEHGCGARARRMLILCPKRNAVECGCERAEQRGKM